MKKNYFFAFFALSPLFLFSQTTVTIQASADNTIYSENNNSNGAGENFNAGSTNTSLNRRALILFNLTSLGTGITIQSVSLTLTCNRIAPASGPRTVTLHRLLNSWGEGTSNAGSLNDGDGALPTSGDATWNYRLYNTSFWATPGGEYSGTVSGSAVVNDVGAYTWGSTPEMVADVQNWVNNPSNNFGWIIIGDQTINRTVKRFASRQNAVVVSRPQLTITYLANLPVRLISFRALEVQKGVELKWETSSEQDNRYFEIEHSQDGSGFQALGRVTGAGNSSELRNYNFLHTDVGNGRHLYRLAQVDWNGSITYSSIQTVQVKNRVFSLGFSPNPARDYVMLKGLIIQPGMELEILNAAGIRMKMNPINKTEIFTGGLGKGIYFVRVFSEGGVLAKGSFVKQ